MSSSLFSIILAVWVAHVLVLFFFLFVGINCSKMIYRFITKIISMFIKGFMHTNFEHLSCSQYNEQDKCSKSRQHIGTHGVTQSKYTSAGYKKKQKQKQKIPHSQWLVCTGLSCVQVVCPAVMLAGWNQFLRCRKQIRLSWFLVVNQVIVGLLLLLQITLVQARYWDAIYI